MMEIMLRFVKFYNLIYYNLFILGINGVLVLKDEVYKWGWLVVVYEYFEFILDFLILDVSR